VSTSPIEWCGASTRGFGSMLLGPCVLSRGHDGPLHLDEAGVSWTDPRPASESSEPLRGADLRDRLAKALRGKYESTDPRPSYRAADGLLPAVEAWAAEQTKPVQQQRDSLLADLKKAERTLAAVEQMCRTAIIPPVAELEARLARRILARIEQSEDS